MTNTIAIWIVILVIGFFLIDHFYVTPKHPAASATLRTVPAVRVAR